MVTGEEGEGTAVAMIVPNTMMERKGEGLERMVREEAVREEGGEVREEVVVPW